MLSAQILTAYNALIGNDHAEISETDLSNIGSAQKVIEQSLPQAVENVLRGHETAPKKTFERMNVLHKLISFTLGTYPGLAFLAGRVLEAAFKKEKNEKLLEYLGDSIEPLAQTFPGFATPIAETMAHRWLTMQDRVPSIHIGQAFNEVCYQTKKHELFIATCLQRTWTDAGCSLGPGSPHFDNHLRSCKKDYGDVVDKILDLHRSKKEGIPGDHAQQYAALISQLT
jgi:hypothetical protein